MSEGEKMRPLSLYIHYPFCLRKCNYCDFLSAPATQEARALYVSALLTEIQERIHAYEEKYEHVPLVDTMFIGGGTPSLLRGEEIDLLMSKLNSLVTWTKDAEISMEANPGTVTKENLICYRAAGINRISLGVQSMNSKELQRLGRIHSSEQAKEAVQLSREAGFTNINIDVMSALPGQSVSSYEDTLREVLALNPEHISAYSLIIEEGTPFGEWYQEGKKSGHTPLPAEEDERRMYEVTRTLLKEHGYERYELSNYAKEGYACRHNIGYWTGHDYLGLGLGAASLLGDTRYTVTRDLHTYQEIYSELSSDRACHSHMDTSQVEARLYPKPFEEYMILTEKERMQEFMFLGLRMTKGVKEEDFAHRFQCKIDEIYGEVLHKHEKEGLLSRENGRVFLTLRGMDLANYVMCDFV